jgi:hypothetical protein
MARTALAGACVAAAAGVARAQSAPNPRLAAASALVARGDTMLIAGRLFGAESAYYAAEHLAPHNGLVRLALGRYLAGRGALRVGATVMEEARLFGADPRLVALDIAPVYTQLGIVDSLTKRKNDWAALAALPASAVPVGERLRAEYLASHPPGIEGPDSTIVLYVVSDSHLLGTVKLVVAGDTLNAVIDARVSGLVLDSAWAHRDSVKRFAARGARDPAAIYGVVSHVRLGAVTLVNAPVRFKPLKSWGNALIGLDLLGALAPTFDPRVGFMMLRRDGRIIGGVPGWKIPSFVARTGVLVVKGETMFPIGHPDVQQYFRVGKWTWDARSGVVVVDSVGVSPADAPGPPT